MPIDSRIVGTPLPESRRDVTVRDVLAYAAGLGETSPHVFDDLGDLQAPPPYCVSLEWPVVSDPRKRDEYGADDDELRRGVHAAQDSIFHRCIRPGDRLVTQGTIRSLRPSRAGAILLSRLETRDAETGEPVTTSWTTSIYRGVDVDGSAEALDEAPPLPERTTEVDASSSVYIAPEMPHVYTECARIWNPIHTERRVARAAGLPDIILHGTATWALASREILGAYAGGEPARLERLFGRFTAMVLPGTDITVEHARRGRVVSFTVRNAEGEPAISQGVAVLR